MNGNLSFSAAQLDDNRIVEHPQCRAVLLVYYRRRAAELERTGSVGGLEPCPPDLSERQTDSMVPLW